MRGVRCEFSWIWEGYWTNRGHANSQIANLQTSQLAGCQSTRLITNS